MAHDQTSAPQPRYDENNPFYKRPGVPVNGPLQSMKPTLYTPLTRLGEQWFAYGETKCAVYEDLLLKCAYQGSKEQMYKRCTKELEDFEECVWKPKQIARFKEIQTQRRKTGEYEEVPVADSFWKRGAH